jgi:hypothetical protein
VSEELDRDRQFGGGPHEGTVVAVRADTATIAAFGHRAAALAERMHSAAAHTRDGDPALLGPVLGPVGATFFAALVATHDAHGRDLDRLGGALAGMSAAATASAAAYERSVDAVARRLLAVQDDA